MAKRYEEAKVAKSLDRVGRVNATTKTLRVSKGANIGIKTWGKIDYLTHYCGWTLTSE